MARKNSGPVFTSLEKKSIVSLSIIMFFRMSGLFLVLPVFSVLALELEFATPALIGFAFGAYALTQAFLQIPFGIWSDHIGRKPVIALGLCLFIAGSVMAALSTSIYEMIAARALQGSGAISAAIFALIADLTRPEVRTRANAGLGASIGLSFGIAIFLGPFLGSWVGLSGLFWTIAGMGTMSLITLLILVPAPAQLPESYESKKIIDMIRTVLEIRPLRVINLGSFVCSMGLAVTFFLIPLIFREYGLGKSDYWKVYLPMLILGGVGMIPAAIFAEVKNRFREVMLFGVVLLLTSLLFLGIGWSRNEMSWFVAALFIFFIGFNVFEPIFPSLVTRLTTPQTKGTASGVYNFSQFLGHFSGAALAGVLYKTQPYILLSIMAVLELLFLYATLYFPNPKQRTTSSFDKSEN